MRAEKREWLKEQMLTKAAELLPREKTSRLRQIGRNVALGAGALAGAGAAASLAATGVGAGLASRGRGSDTPQRSGTPQSSGGVLDQNGRRRSAPQAGVRAPSLAGTGGHANPHALVPRSEKMWYHEAPYVPSNPMFTPQELHYNEGPEYWKAMDDPAAKARFAETMQGPMPPGPPPPAEYYGYGGPRDRHPARIEAVKNSPFITPNYTGYGPYPAAYPPRP